MSCPDFRGGYRDSCNLVRENFFRKGKGGIFRRRSLTPKGTRHTTEETQTCPGLPIFQYNRRGGVRPVSRPSGTTPPEPQSLVRNPEVRRVFSYYGTCLYDFGTMSGVQGSLNEQKWSVRGSRNLDLGSRHMLKGCNWWSTQDRFGSFMCFVSVHRDRRNNLRSNTRFVEILTHTSRYEGPYRHRRIGTYTTTPERILSSGVKDT